MSGLTANYCEFTFEFIYDGAPKRGMEVWQQFRQVVELLC